MDWVCHTGDCQFTGDEDEAVVHSKRTGHVSFNTVEEIPDGSYYDTTDFD